MKKNLIFLVMAILLASCNQLNELPEEVSQSGNLILKSAGDITITKNVYYSAGTNWTLPNGAWISFQTDGNLVIYSAAANHPVMFASGTNGKPNARLLFQNDGNLVIYNGSTPIWATGTQNRGINLKFVDPGCLVITDDADVVIWRSHHLAGDSESFFSANTSYYPGTDWIHSSGTVMRYQTDGNLVIYSDNTYSNVLYATGTQGYPGSRLVFQGDGNLVIYNGNSAIWKSNTVGNGQYVKFVSEGLMIFDINNQILWKTFFTEIPSNLPFNERLAKRWAPIFVQWIDYTGEYGQSGMSDFIAPLNYDGDWNSFNNWENLSPKASGLKGKVYYSVTETSTHWFLFYCVLHPRDWTDIAIAYNLDMHENDNESVLQVIKKNGTEYGQVEAAVTVAHSDFYSFKAFETPNSMDASLDMTDYMENNPVYTSPYTNNEETIDGNLYVTRYHDQKYARPIISVSAKSHSIKAWPQQEGLETAAIIYRPSLIPEEKAVVPYMPGGNPTGGFRIPAYYELEDIFAPGGLYSYILDGNVFTSGTHAIGGNTWGGSAASAPWSLNDGDDSLKDGYFSTHAGLLISRYFGNLGNYSRTYTSNPYEYILTNIQNDQDYVPGAAW